MMKIEILGTGCAKCETLANQTKAAADQLGLEYEFCKVTELNEIMKRGVMITPALVINGKLKVSGKIPSQAELTTLLTSELV